MARITIAYVALEKGQFPPVCCKTGVHTDNYVRMRFVQTPSWTWILLPFGFFPFLIARLFVAQEFDGVLPMSPQVAKRLNRLRRATFLVGALGLTGLIAGVFGETAFAIAGIVLIGIGAITLLVGTITSPDCKRDLDRGAAELSSVHRRFVETIEAAWAQAAQEPEGTP
jgi:hypothetical protein